MKIKFDFDSITKLITQTLYVDLNDLETPIKYLYTEVGYFDFTIASNLQTFQFEVERNEIELEDNWWDFLSQPSQIQMNSLSYKESQFTEFDGIKSRLLWRINLGKVTNQFGRKVLNFLEVTGVIGGIFELLDILVGAFISFIYSYMLKRELQKDLVVAQSEIVKLQESLKKIQNNDSGNSLEGF